MGDYSREEGYKDFVEFQEAQLRLTARANALDEKSDDLDRWARELNDREDELLNREDEAKDTNQRARRAIESLQSEREVLENAKQEAILKIASINKANVNPVHFMDEVILMLELGGTPKELAEYLREKRELLEARW